VRCNEEGVLLLWQVGWARLHVDGANTRVVEGRLGSAAPALASGRCSCTIATVVTTTIATVA
jgi:hypothetical protein